MRTSPHKQSPDWRFQLQRHACEITSRDINCLAVGNKAFQQGNANCISSWPWRVGQYTSLICSTPQASFAMFGWGPGIKAPFNCSSKKYNKISGLFKCLNTSYVFVLKEHFNYDPFFESTLMFPPSFSILVCNTYFNYYNASLAKLH